MGILKLIKERRSVRRFIKKEVSFELLKKVLEAGRFAPSGLNNQPWRFIVVKNREIKNRLSSFTKYSQIVKEANVLILVFLDEKASYSRVKDTQAIGACIENMLLEAHSLGLGGVWLGEILKSKYRIRRFLNLSKDFNFQAAIALGYPAYRPGAPRRKPLFQLILKVIE